MGQSKSKVKRFLDANKICIFCGGTQAASTQDHIPPRSFFINCKWPEGYVFPACKECNNQSSDAEYVVSIFAKMGWELLPGHNIDPKFYDDLLLKLKQKKPAIFNAMQNEISAAAKKRIVRDAGLKIAPGTTFGEIPIINVPIEVEEDIKFFGLKLSKALHYKHSGVVVPSVFRYKFRWITNFQEIQREFRGCIEIFKSLESAKQLKRDNVDLSQQFSYSYAITDNAKSSAFYCKFSNSFSIIILLTFDEEYYERFGKFEST